MIRPMRDLIVVQRKETKDKTDGGIFLPEQAKEAPDAGLVVFVGPGKKLEDGTRIEMDLKIGDHILFSKFSGSDIQLNLKPYLIMREDEVLAVIPEEE